MSIDWSKRPLKRKLKIIAPTHEMKYLRKVLLGHVCTAMDCTSVVVAELHDYAADVKLTYCTKHAHYVVEGSSKLGWHVVVTHEVGVGV